MGLQIRSAAEQIKSIQFADATATTKKVPVVENSLVFIPLNTAGAAEENVYVYEAEISGAPKATGEAWAIGQALYWHVANGNFTTTSTGATACGFALEARLTGDTTGGLQLFKTFV